MRVCGGGGDAKSTATQTGLGLRGVWVRVRRHASVDIFSRVSAHIFFVFAALRFGVYHEAKLRGTASAVWRAVHWSAHCTEHCWRTGSRSGRGSVSRCPLMTQGCVPETLRSPHASGPRSSPVHRSPHWSRERNLQLSPDGAPLTKTVGDTHGHTAQRGRCLHLTASCNAWQAREFLPEAS